MKEKVVISQIKAGFGNQLFQYAAGYSAAKKIGAEFKLDISFFENNDEFTFKLENLNIDYTCANKNEINELKSETTTSIFFRILKKIGFRNKYNKKSSIYEEAGFKADKRINLLNHSAYIVGWCNSINYFKENKIDLLELFTSRQAFSVQANYYLEKINSSNSVSIHIRRGDYITLESFFRVLPIEYYKNAVDEISKHQNNLKFFIFSNDLDWAKENLNFIYNVEFVDLNYNRDYLGKADIEEFFLMKHCKHNIIANSSFSWWPAYLNENDSKVIILPKKWFNDVSFQKKYEESPLALPNWITL
jgi:hypothetical protein